jgi:hypothetical protein
VSGRLDLRRGVVVSASPLIVEIDGQRRRAWADEVLLGPMRAGAEVIVNAAALDLELGSGGFDVVHVNLTRGLGGGLKGGAHVMKLNYTSLQHPVEPVEGLAGGERGGDDANPLVAGSAAGAPSEQVPGGSAARRAIPVAVLPLHGHLAPAAFAAAQTRPGIRIGYVQTAGGALPGSMSHDVVALRERGLLCGHITAAPSYGGENEALSTVGALDAAATSLGWDAVLVGPGPGIIGSDTEYGHGGMSALDNAHASLSLGLPTIISPRLSASDPRQRHRGLSHHTATVLQLLLAPITVAIPEGTDDASSQIEAASANRHRLEQVPVNLDAYAAAGLPTSTMGRQLPDDPLFFEAPIAAGTLLATLGRVAP